MRQHHQTLHFIVGYDVDQTRITVKPNIDVVFNREGPSAIALDALRDPTILHNRERGHVHRGTDPKASAYRLHRVFAYRPDEPVGFCGLLQPVYGVVKVHGAGLYKGCAAFGAKTKDVEQRRRRSDVRRLPRITVPITVPGADIGWWKAGRSGRI